ncbi:GDP-mannose 4,6-dehydratase [uncultured Leifsonia sp.]|uniref:GDP-mannose 4,6-dehydratase n=1 Tax=uncultured Leifsonia sp. TaxID=340359 RepID=UPI0025CCC624|nr:GDP-mannose 4,6-dehydratase [uncultured Leifsonia sp.]
MSAERFLVTGAAGQDGRYLVDRLIADGAEVHALVHGQGSADLLASRAPQAIRHLGDLTDATATAALVAQVRPTHIVNLAGITSVARSWAAPAATADVLGVGPVTLMEAAWALQTDGHPVRFVQASSAEIFGDAREVPQTEDTSLAPVSPYGAAKAFAQTMVRIFRDRGLFAASGILYNHESPERAESFVSRKISREVARIRLGLSDRLVLGNLDAERDWGYAPDYVDALLRIARAPGPDDFVVATGQSHSVRDFVVAAFRHVGIAEWESYVGVDPQFLRPVDPNRQIGNAARLRALGWRPSVSFDELVALMVDADLRELSR